MAGVDINRTTSGVSLTPEVSAEIWASTIEQSAVMQVARQVTLPGSGITIPSVTADAVADWVDETDEKPVSRATLSNKTITPYTLAVIEPFSNQFRRDLPALYNELARRLPGALAKKFDETVYGTNAAPGGNFDRLTGATTMTVDSTGTFLDLAAVLSAVAATGAELTDWIVNPALHALMLTATDTLGRQFFSSAAVPSAVIGSVFGADVIRTRGTMPTGSGANDDKIGFAGDWRNGAVWGSVEGVQISISDQASITDGTKVLTDSGTDTTTVPNVINLWQRNMFAVRAEIEIGFRIRNASDFIAINDGSADG